jgi:hypothetical protein
MGASTASRRSASVFRGRSIVAVGVALVVAACGGGSPSAAPASAAPSPLAPGTYTSVAFKPAVTFTVPAGWENPDDQAAYMLVRPLGDDLNGIHFFAAPSALSQAADCPASAEPNVGTSSIELIAWIRSLKGLTVSSPAMATIGGYPATSIDISIAPGWAASCAFANGTPTVPLLFKAPGLRWVVAGGERLRLYFVDRTGSGLVIVDLDSFDGTGFEGLLAAAAPVVKSLKFAGG